jgi:hypothetical protein
MKYTELDKLASKLTLYAYELGCRGVIVALSSEEGGHSEFSVRVAGPCIEVEGLATHIPTELSGLWPRDQKSRTTSKDVCSVHGPSCEGKRPVDSDGNHSDILTIESNIYARSR